MAKARHGKIPMMVRVGHRSPTVAATHRQLAHEAFHRSRKYDKDGRRRPDSLPPKHLRGQYWGKRSHGE